MSETDLISRQAAIEVIDAVFPVDPMKSEYAQGIACGAALSKTYVEQLPSAQPEPSQVARDIATIIENEQDMRVILKNAQPDAPDTNGGDIIYRRAAIDAADRADYTGLAIEDVKKVTDEVVKEIKKLPSAQPEIIRCKDCKHKHIENMVWTCPFGLPGGENFFCGYGAEPYKGEQE